MTDRDGGLARLVLSLTGLPSKLAEIPPQVKRGMVFCLRCGRTERIAGRNFETGWPKCCGYTMSLDSPEEREAFAQQETDSE